LKKVRIVLFIIAIYLFIYFLQVNFFSWFNIRGVQPNLVAVLVLFIGLYTNSRFGSISGFFIGLYTDFLFSDSVGISAVLYAAVGYSGEFLQKRFPKNSKITLIIMSSITTSAYEIIRACYRYLFFSSYIGFIAFFITLAIELLFNTLLVIIFYPLINKTGAVIDDTFNGNDTITKYF